MRSIPGDTSVHCPQVVPFLWGGEKTDTQVSTPAAVATPASSDGCCVPGLYDVHLILKTALQSIVGIIMPGL